MNYHLTIALIVFTTIIVNGKCNAGNASEHGKTETGQEQGKVQEFAGEIKEENRSIFMNLVVKAFIDSPKCQQEGKDQKTYFNAEDGKCMITKKGIEFLNKGKNLCKIRLQIDQLEKHDSLKRDMERLSTIKNLWDGHMTDWGVKAIRADLVAYILEGMEGEVEVTDKPLMHKITVCQNIYPKQSHQQKGSEPLETRKPTWQLRLIEKLLKKNGPPSATQEQHEPVVRHQKLGHSNPNGGKHPEGKGHPQIEGANGKANAINLEKTADVETGASDFEFPAETNPKGRKLPRGDHHSSETQGSNGKAKEVSMKRNDTNGASSAARGTLEEEGILQPTAEGRGKTEKEDLIES